jgi:hypothetical protein
MLPKYQVSFGAFILHLHYKIKVCINMKVISERSFIWKPLLNYLEIYYRCCWLFIIDFCHCMFFVNELGLCEIKYLETQYTQSILSKTFIMMPCCINGVREMCDRYQCWKMIKAFIDCLKKYWSRNLLIKNKTLFDRQKKASITIRQSKHLNIWKQCDS